MNIIYEGKPDTWKRYRVQFKMPDQSSWMGPIGSSHDTDTAALAEARTHQAAGYEVRVIDGGER